MKTVKIKVEIEVTEGNYCQDKMFNICDMYDEQRLCIVFGDELVTEESGKWDARILKCQACLDACKGAQKRQ